jgi:glycosyltransferase involved in cell wall biosynthesis
MDDKKYKPDATIIIRTKDRPLFLNRALNSLAKQSYDDFEVILVNDGGDKLKVEEVLKSYNHLDIKVLNNPRSIGRAQAFNQALASANAEIIGCLDDDDTYSDKDFLTDGLRFYWDSKRRDPDLVGIVCRSYEVLERVVDRKDASEFNYQSRIEILETTVLEKYNTGHKTIRPYAYFVGQDNFLPVQTLFSRSVMLELGGFEEKNDVLEDRPLYTRMLDVGRIKILDRFLVSHHSRVSAYDPNHVNSMSVDFPADWSESFSDYHLDGYYRDVPNRVFFYALLKEALEFKFGLDFRRENLHHFVTKFPIYFLRFMKRRPIQFGLFFSFLTVWTVMVVTAGSLLAHWLVGG